MDRSEDMKWWNDSDLDDYPVSLGFVDVGADEPVQEKEEAPSGKESRAYPKPFLRYPMEGFLCPIEEALADAAVELQRMKEDE